MFSSIIVVHIPWTITRAPTIWPIPTVASRPWPLAHVHAGAGQPGSRPAGSSTARRFSPTLATEHCIMRLWTNKLDRGLAKLLNVWVNGKETGRIREFPCKKREPKIWSGKSFPRFCFRIYRIFVSEFNGFFLNFEFSCKNDIRSVYMVYGVGRYGIFPFLLSSLFMNVLCLLNIHILWLLFLFVLL